MKIKFTTDMTIIIIRTLIDGSLACYMDYMKTADIWQLSV